MWAFDDVWTVHLHRPAASPQQVAGRQRQAGPQVRDRRSSWRRSTGTTSWPTPATCTPTRWPATTPTASTRFYAGKALIASGGTGAWNLADDQSGTAANPNYRRGAFNVFAADGKSTPRHLPRRRAPACISYLNKQPEARPDPGVPGGRQLPGRALRLGRVHDGQLRRRGHPLHDGRRRADGTPRTGKKEVQAQTYPFLASPAAAISNPGADMVTKDYAAWQAAEREVRCTSRCSGT